MTEKKLHDLTDAELLQVARKLKATAIMNAVLIGFVVGVLVYSLMRNKFGFLTLILFFLAYKLINNSKYNRKEVEELLKERNLK